MKRIPAGGKYRNQVCCETLNCRLCKPWIAETLNTCRLYVFIYEIPRQPSSKRTLCSFTKLKGTVIWGNNIQHTWAQLKGVNQKHPVPRPREKQGFLKLFEAGHVGGLWHLGGGRLFQRDGTATSWVSVNWQGPKQAPPPPRLYYSRLQNIVYGSSLSWDHLCNFLNQQYDWKSNHL